VKIEEDDDRTLGEIMGIPEDRRRIIGDVTAMTPAEYRAYLASIPVPPPPKKRARPDRTGPFAHLIRTD
jgi:hypothetical protein